MMRVGLCSLMALSACNQASAPTSDDFGYKGTGIAVAVSPLTLDSLGDACYSFAVVNAASELVVGRGPSVNGMVGVTGLPIAGTAVNAICASRFGNTTGGDFSYVAPCDAQQPLHQVHLWVESLCAQGQTGQLCDEIQGYVNPCSGAAGCTLPVTCVENADTPVTFNFTIMGQADQGFFDIAVNFESIFCSAKLDTCYGNDPETDAIDLLFGPDNERAPTAVLGLACTAGAGTTEGTYLHAGNVKVDCGGQVTTLDLSTVSAEGNQLAVGDIAWAAYFGSEALSGAAGSWNKEFFNVAITGFGASCEVSWVATASDGTLPGSGLSGGVLSTYPVINYGPTAITAADGAWICTQNPINGPGSGVTTGYVPCAEPGDCLQGPCITTQAGSFIDCADGLSQDCSETGITVIITGADEEFDADGGQIGTASFTYEFFLTAGPDINGEPSYSETLSFGAGEVQTLTFFYNGSQWEFTAGAGLDSDTLGTSTLLFGNWQLSDTGGGDGITAIQVECGGVASYACASWEDVNGQGATYTAQVEMFLIDYQGTTDFYGWGVPDSGGGIYVEGGSPTWQLTMPQDYTANTFVPSSSDAPWGTYTTTWAGGGVAPPIQEYVVTVAPGLCPELPALPAEANPVFTIANMADGWHIFHTDTASVPPTATFTDMTDGTPSPFPSQAPRIDATYVTRAGIDRVIAFNTNQSNNVALAFGVFDSATSDPTGGAYTAAVTAGTWAVESGITPTPAGVRSMIAPGWVLDSAGNLNAFAMHAGRRGGQTGFHFFSLRIEGSAVITTHIGFVAPSVDGGTALAAWGALDQSRARRIAAIQTGIGKARIVVVGPLLGVGQLDDGQTYVNVFDVDLAVPGSFALTSEAATSEANLSIVGWLGPDHVAVAQAYDTGSGAALALGSLALSSAQLSTTTTGLAYTTRAAFGAYSATTGEIFGFWQFSNRLGFHWLGASFPSVNGGVSAANYYQAPDKFEGVGFFDNQ